MKSRFLRRFAFALVALCCIGPAMPAAADSGGGESARHDPGALLSDAARIQESGCVPEPASGAAACGAVTSLVGDLNAVGEYLGAAVTCAALESRGSLPADALVPCAFAEVRLGGGVAASRYLDRFAGAAASDAELLDRTMTAADILISGTRYKDASPYLEAAARLAGKIDPARLDSISKAIFINSLNSGNPAGAVRAARALGSGSVQWVVGEYTARGFARQALDPVRTIVADGVDSFDELGLVVSVFSVLGMSEDAGAAASSCLARCPGADVLSVASVLARGGMDRDAAAFAGRNRSRFAVQADADFEIGFLWLAAGDAEKGVRLLSDWAIPTPAGANSGIDYSARQVRVEERLLAEGRYDTAAVFGAAVRQAGGVFQPDVAPDMVSALVKAGKADDAIASAREILSGDAGCSSLRYRLSALFYASGEYESSLSLLDACRGDSVRTSEDPLLPARVHLLRARLIRGGYVAGDVDSELIAALAAAGTDRALVESVDRFASSLVKGKELELAAARSLVALSPEDSAAHNRLAMARIAAGDEDGAVESFNMAVELEESGTDALSVAIDALLGAGLVNGAVSIFQRWKNLDNLSPALAYRIGRACMESGDRDCVSIFLNRFLDGPVSDEVNYYELADSFISTGWFGLARKTLDVAGKADPLDRSARTPWLRGRLALLSGDAAGARANYDKAVDDAPVKGLMVMAISGDYARAGRLSESIRWLDIGIKDASPDVRAQVFPMWVDTLRRLGRAGEITLEPLDDVEIASLEDWERSIDLLEACGRADLAIELVSRVKESVSASELGPLLVRLTGLHCSARDRDGALSTAAAACGWAVSFSGDHCVQASALLAYSGLGLDGMTTVGEFGPASTIGLSAAGIAALVATALNEKGVDSAFASAGLVTPAVYLETSSLLQLMGGLSAAAGARAWDAYISGLSARSDMDRDGSVHLDAARAAFAVGDDDRARGSLAKYLESPSGDMAMAALALVADGRFDDADTLLKGAPDTFWASLEYDQLGLIAAAYQLRGWSDGVDSVFSRFISASNESASARQAVARVRSDLGDWRGAARDIGALPDSSLDPDARAAMGIALWRSGDRAGAMAQFRKVASSSRDEFAFSTAQERVAGFLFAQIGTGRERAEVLESGPESTLFDSELLMAAAIANLSVNDPEHTAAARKALFELLRDSRSVAAIDGAVDGLNIREYVILEARLGSAGDLARAALRIRGAAFAQTAMYASCLSGDEETFRAAREILFPGRLLGGGPEALADPADLLAVAGINYSCGRFSDAADFALRYIKGGHVDSDGMIEAVTIAVKASAAAGRKNPITPAFVMSLTDDRLLRSSFVSTAAATAGDGRAVVESLETLLPLMSGSESLVMEAISARLSAGQNEGLAQYASNLVAALPDQSTAWHSAFQIMSSSFRFEEAAGFARIAMDRSPDRLQAEIDLYSVLTQVGDVQGALAAADDVLSEMNSPSVAAMGLLEMAVAAGRLPVVMSLVERIAGDQGGVYTSTLPPAQAAAALRAVQLLDAVQPGSTVARRFLDKAWDWSIDRQYFCASAVRSLTDGWHEPGDMYVQNVSRLFADGRCSSVDMSNRLRDTVAALSGSAAAYGRFSAAWSLEDLRQLIRAAAFTAILQGRIDDALSWLDGVSVPGFTASENIELLVDATGYLSDRPGLSDADVERIGSFGLRFLRENSSGDHRYAMIEATFVASLHDVKEFTALMDREIAFNPAGPDNRNMTAYSLSIRGREQARFRKDVKLAVVLAGADRGGYLETEAWGNFVYGGGERALKMQRAASVYWNSRDYSFGLPECWNHYGSMLDALGHDGEAAEMYRRSLMTSGGWDWHGILSARKLRDMGYFTTKAGD